MRRTSALALALVLLLAAPVARAQDAPPIDATAPAVNTGAVPAWIDIPSIGTHAAIVPLAEDDDGAMQSPPDPDTVGWYQLGFGLGVPGNALLDGHVDWGGRLRVFGLLNQLQPGDTIQLTDANGNLLRYAVQWTVLVDAAAAPVDDIFAQGPAEEITLITCGGAFDQSIHMYVSRWVVRAVRTPLSAN